MNLEQFFNEFNNSVVKGEIPISLSGFLLALPELGGTISWVPLPVHPRQHPSSRYPT